MKPELEEKYAKFWHETNSWEIPKGLEPLNRLTPEDRYSHELYASGIWKLLNMMAKDGLITQTTLRRLHEQEPGMKPGQSRIKI